MSSLRAATARQVRGAHAATIAREWRALRESCWPVVAPSAWAATRRACPGTAPRSPAAPRACSRAVAEPPVIVVCAPEQELPPLPRLGAGRARPRARPRAAGGARRRARRRGPARGGRCGLRRRRSARPPRRAGWRCSARSATSPAVVPLANGVPQPLFAVYRTELAFLAAALVADGERRAAALGERSGARAVEPFELLVVDDIAAFDPGLASFLELRRPRRLRRRARGAAAARDGHGRSRRPARAARLDRRPRAAPAARRRGAAARQPPSRSTTRRRSSQATPARAAR